MKNKDWFIEPTSTCARRWQEREATISELAANLLVQRRGLERDSRLTKEWESLFRYTLKYLVWRFTEARGKYQGCPFWSVDAAAEANRRGNVTDDKGKALFRHEHVVPNSEVQTQLLQVSQPTSAEVHGVLGQYAVSAVVTQPEDRLLTAAGLRSAMLDGAANNPWARYATASIRMDQHSLLPTRHEHWMSAAGLF